MMGAALVDGFVTPRVAILGAGLRAADLSITAQLLNLCMLFNQALARILVGPRFVFRFESDPDSIAPGAAHHVRVGLGERSEGSVRRLRQLRPRT